MLTFKSVVLEFTKKNAGLTMQNLQLKNTELEILYLMSKGVRVVDIGNFICRSKRCVENRLSNLRYLVQAKTNYQLIYVFFCNLNKEHIDNLFEKIDTKKYHKDIEVYFNDLEENKLTHDSRKGY